MIKRKACCFIFCLFIHAYAVHIFFVYIYNIHIIYIINHTLCLQGSRALCFFLNPSNHSTNSPPWKNGAQGIVHWELRQEVLLKKADEGDEDVEMEMM